MIFPFPAGNSRRRRRLKNPGAVAPGFTGVWGRTATNKRAPVYTGALLATTTALPSVIPTVLKKSPAPEHQILG